MAIWRRCSKRTCANPRRCLEHLWFDVTHQGTRFRVPANEFAIPLMDPNKQREIARKGGKASGGNFAHDRERAAAAGREGGKASRVRAHA